MSIDSQLLSCSRNQGLLFTYILSFTSSNAEIITHTLNQGFCMFILLSTHIRKLSTGDNTFYVLDLPVCFALYNLFILLSEFKPIVRTQVNKNFDPFNIVTIHSKHKCQGILVLAIV